MSKTQAQQADLFTQQAVIDAIVNTEHRMRGEINRQGRVIVEQARRITELEDQE
jgi:hypothetical protein